ncbi:MAG TPA: BamA/TamA family outer membrane protein [Gemmatimonadaceae bacterium]|nr:BamA/TamA family outer membrane protein [Gemmatimonadaceae bacterium]
MTAPHLKVGPPVWWAALVSLFLSLATPLYAQRGDEMERPEVEEVELTGVESVDKDELKDGLATHPSQCRSLLFYPFCLISDHSWFVEKAYLDEDEFQRDVLRIKVYYWRRGFREAQVDTTVTPEDDGVAVRFAVAEGPPTLVSSITLQQEGARVLTNEEIEEIMRLRAGMPLNLVALDSSLVLIREELFERGYADAEVAADTIIVSADDRTAAVRIGVSPGWLTRVGTITVTGTKDVSTTTVLNSMVLAPGELYRREALLESQRALYESGLYRQASIAVVTDSATPDGITNLEVQVREAPFREMRLSGGFNTVDFIQVEQRFTKYNFLGGGRRLDARGVVGNILAPQLNGVFPFHDVTPGSLAAEDEDRFLNPNWQLSLEFTQPWWLSPRNTLAAATFAHRRSAPGIYIDRGFGASATFTRRMVRRSPVSLSYRYEVTEVEAGDVYFCQSFGVCELSTIDALRGRQHLSPLSLSYFTDRSNDLFFPSDGYLARLDAEHASAYTLSDFRYNRLSGQLSRYFAIGGGVIATRLRGGWIRNLASTAEGVGARPSEGEVILHPRKRFYAGGSQSVRGYAENQLGPRVLTVSPDALIAPRVNAAGDSIAGCSEADIANRVCDPTGVPSSQFQPRPTGGTSVLEASVEYRFRIWQQLLGAVFLDGALVGEGAITDVTQGAGALTPGIGVRYGSPAGVIRIDLGIRPTLVERLPVVTESAPDSAGRAQIVRLEQSFRYDPLEGSRSGLRQVINRLQLHLSIGQAF